MGTPDGPCRAAGSSCAATGAAGDREEAPRSRAPFQYSGRAGSHNSFGATGPEDAGSARVRECESARVRRCEGARVRGCEGARGEGASLALAGGQVDDADRGSRVGSSHADSRRCRAAEAAATKARSPPARAVVVRDRSSSRHAGSRGAVRDGHQLHAVKPVSVQTQSPLRVNPRLERREALRVGSVWRLAPVRVAGVRRELRARLTASIAEGGSRTTTARAGGLLAVVAARSRARRRRRPAPPPAPAQTQRPLRVNPRLERREALRAGSVWRLAPVRVAGVRHELRARSTASIAEGGSRTTTARAGGLLAVVAARSRAR